MEIPDASFTLGDLKRWLEIKSGVPTQSQKILFKGQTLKDDAQSVIDVGMKGGSKVMLLGRKHSPEQEALSRPLDEVDKATDEIEIKIKAICEEIEGIEKGFLQSELVPEACRGVNKRCDGCTEHLMQKLETLDALEIPASEVLMRSRRKAIVLRIQAVMKKLSDISSRIDKLLNK